MQFWRFNIQSTDVGLRVKCFCLFAIIVKDKVSWLNSSNFILFDWNWCTAFQWVVISIWHTVQTSNNLATRYRSYTCGPLMHVVILDTNLLHMRKYMIITWIPGSLLLVCNNNYILEFLLAYSAVVCLFCCCWVILLLLMVKSCWNGVNILADHKCGTCLRYVSQLSN